MFYIEFRVEIIAHFMFFSLTATTESQVTMINTVYDPYHMKPRLRIKSTNLKPLYVDYEPTLSLEGYLLPCIHILRYKMRIKFPTISFFA